MVVGLRVPNSKEVRDCCLDSSDGQQLRGTGARRLMALEVLAGLLLTLHPEATFTPCQTRSCFSLSKHNLADLLQTVSSSRHSLNLHINDYCLRPRMPLMAVAAVGQDNETAIPAPEIINAGASLAGGVGSVIATLTAAAVAASSPGGGALQEELGRRGAEIVTAVGKMSPTYVKFAQALAQRPDLVGASFASSLSSLQDRMSPFDTVLARDIISRELRGREGYEELFSTLSAEPVAAASVGQVYRAKVKGRDVAVKVRRPRVVERIRADAAILRSAAAAVETLPALGGGRLVRARAVDAVDEFVLRLLEEANFENEARNLAKFASLYGEGGSASLPAPGVVCPEALLELCTSDVIVMTWVDGTRLVPDGAAGVPASDLPLLRLGIACTLSQLLDTGVMHADPHGGNLLKTNSGRLAYLDFGLVSEVPLQVREGLVCAVAYLIAKDFRAIASLFGELMLLPQRVLDDTSEATAFASALQKAAEAVLDYESGEGGVPVLRFDRLIGALGGIAPRFEFTLPPYFLNNARAIGTLEGMAKSADPGFNVLSEVYGFAARRLLAGGREQSERLSATLQDLTSDRRTGEPDIRKAWLLLTDAARLAGVPRRRVMLDALKGARGRALAVSLARQVVVRARRNLLRIPRQLWRSLRGTKALAVG